MNKGIRRISLLLKHHKEDLKWHNKSVDSWIEAWYELIYCVLAGSKVHTRTVEKSYENLITQNPKKILFTNFVLKQKESIIYVRRILKDSGYRFYNSKSETILNAALFYISIYNELESNKIDAKSLRAKLVDNVNGIGIKTATHWLRNIGFDFPVVDVHTRNILVRTRLIDKKFKKDSLSTTEYLYIENVLFGLSRKLSKRASSIDYALWKHGMENCQCCTVLYK